jgi:hypothetical protein
MFDAKLRASRELEGTRTMGTIHEFPQWHAQRSPPAETERAAQIIIFPGVRIERHDAVRNRFMPLPAGPANLPRKRRRTSTNSRP